MDISFLKRFGLAALQVAAKVTGVAQVVAPLIESFLPDGTGKTVIQRIESDLPKLAKVIQDVEVVGAVLGTPGVDKARAAAPLIGQVLLNSPFLAGHKIADADLFKKGCQEVGAGLADILNSLDADGVRETKPQDAE